MNQDIQRKIITAVTIFMPTLYTEMSLVIRKHYGGGAVLGNKKQEATESQTFVCCWYSLSHTFINIKYYFVSFARE